MTRDELDIQPRLGGRYREFLEASLPGASRMSIQEAAHQRDRDLIRLGEALGQALLPGAVGRELTAALDRTAAAGETLRLEFEAAPDLLPLPFEAARLPDGRIPALEPGVRVLRRQLGLAGKPVASLPAPCASWWSPARRTRARPATRSSTTSGSSTRAALVRPTGLARPR